MTFDPAPPTLTCAECGLPIQRAEGVGAWTHFDEEIVVTFSGSTISKMRTVGADHQAMPSFIEGHLAGQSDR